MINIPAFTPRENDVLNAMLASAAEHGHTSRKEIAQRLVVSERTVRAHLEAMFKKAKVGDKTALALWAMRNGGTGE